MKNYFVLLVIIFFASSCDDQGKIIDTIPGNSVDFYSLSDYQTQDHSMKIIENTVELSDSIIIPYHDILAYQSKTHTFIITDHLSEILSDWENNPLARKTFAVVADRDIIYTGYFWYSFMSSSCDWIVIDPIDYSGEDKLRIQLGYPGLIDGDTIPDNRNDPRLLNVLRRDGKLMD